MKMGESRQKVSDITGSNLKKIVDSYMQKVPEVKEYCDRCLKTERWYGNVVLMVVDAAFTSIGLNYFQTVVPRVERFRLKFLESAKIRSLEELPSASDDELEQVWKNKRSWHIAKSIATYLTALKRQRKLDDKQAFVYWAQCARLENWEKDPIGIIKGVGINTFQYLRMMGGVDTVMPDKIVKRVIGNILFQANIELPSTDIEFIQLVEQIAPQVGYKAIELCWMTWLIQSEARLSRMQKYSAILPKI